jgi:nucleotide-binding universal stress UspA family protein
MNNPILLATDGSATATEAAKTAIELATALGAPLLIVSAWDVTYEPIGVGFGPVLPDIDRIGHEEAQRTVDGAAGPAREAGLEVDTIVRRGRPVEQICEIADEHDPYLIVLGSHGRGAVRRTLFGSVSTGVLHHAHQPVLVVPAGKTSPGFETVEREEVTA